MTLDRICVSTWSFHTLFETGRMQVLDFPELVADRFGVHNLEIVAPHFGDADAREVQARLDRAHSRIVNIPVDIQELWETPSLSSPDSAVSARAVALYSEWIDRARNLGVHSVRCDPGLLNLQDLAPTIASYRKLVEYGRPRGVDVIVENHGTASQYPEQLAEVLRQSGAGSLPDFGNFPDSQTRQRGLRLLFPLAKSLCHVKRIPELPRCLEIADEFGFAGVYSIETGTPGDSYEDVQDVIDALR
jgi:sugar phosphate isomerase/epimerase